MRVPDSRLPPYLVPGTPVQLETRFGTEGGAQLIQAHFIDKALKNPKESLKSPFSWVHERS